MFYTSEWHNVSYALIKENKRDIVHVLNGFYDFSDEDTEDILYYIEDNLQYQGHYLLYDSKFTDFAKNNQQEIVSLVQSGKIQIPN